jgi:4-carboxymuconolactone decarboxylase
MFDRFVARRGQVGGPYSILLHSPAIADQVDTLSATLRSASSLSAAEYVLTALAVARARDCVFVWSVQAPAARRAGVAEATIQAIGARSFDALPADVADLVAYATALASANRLDQALFDRLHAAHDTRWLVELTAVAGHFGLISGVNNAFEVGASPGGDELPA